MKVAAVNYKIRSIARPEDFDFHVEEVVREAAEQGAQLVVLPELLTLELLQLAPHIEGVHIVDFLAAYFDPYIQVLTNLAEELKLSIVGGSTLTRERLNVCPTVDPQGTLSLQSKIVLTQWEIHEFGLKPGQGMVPSPVPGLASLICYDSEFPEGARLLAEDGAWIVALPSFTETAHGFHRVRTGGLARAQENQVFVVQSCLVGNLGGEPVPSTYGKSAILSPSQPPFSAGGILAETAEGEEEICYAHLDHDTLMVARNSGDVRNWNDRNAGAWI